jgi:hypothetical protein
MYTQKFIKKYKEALENDYRHFYDDLDEYGNKDAEIAFYFIEGINGVPGQIRFALPSVFKEFGKNIYIKCLYLEEFSCKQLIWDKYTIENIDKKRDKIVSDLHELGRKYKEIKIITSSNGFYDFLHAYPKLSKKLLKKSQLFWVAVAPDYFEDSKWKNFFYKLNGFKKNGYTWFAFPNTKLLKFLNPELSMKHNWKHKGMKKSFYKNDLELRFKVFGTRWAYASIDCFNEILKHIVENSKFPIDMESYILVATSDGYWQGKSIKEINRHIDKYFSNKKVIYKKASHLWVLMPENISELLALARESD